MSTTNTHREQTIRDTPSLCDSKFGYRLSPDTDSRIAISGVSPIKCAMAFRAETHDAGKVRLGSAYGFTETHDAGKVRLSSAYRFTK